MTQDADCDCAPWSAGCQCRCHMPDFGTYYECPTCDDGWDFVGGGPHRCLHCGAQIDGRDDA